MPGRRVLKAQRVTRHAQAQREIEDMRYRLPVNQYLEVLHRVATQGQLYEYDARGDLIGTRQVTPKEQTDAAKYLLDKAMPNQAPQKLDSPDELTAESAAENISQLDTEQLRNLIAHHTTDNNTIQFPTPVITDVDTG